MISQANRRPGYATCFSTRPVEAFRPRSKENSEFEFGNWNFEFVSDFLFLQRSLIFKELLVICTHDNTIS